MSKRKRKPSRAAAEAPMEKPAPAKAQAAADAPAPASPDTVVLRHLKWGWWSLLLFVLFGLTLEVLHGFKVPLYLDASNETRRLMWTLAHAHGTLVALGHLGFVQAVQYTPGWAAGSRKLASRTLIAAGMLLPLGFFLGGVWTLDGDPGPAVLISPVGGIMLVVAIFLTARAVSKRA